MPCHTHDRPMQQLDSMQETEVSGQRFDCCTVRRGRRDARYAVGFCCRTLMGRDPLELGEAAEVAPHDDDLLVPLALAEATDLFGLLPGHVLDADPKAIHLEEIVEDAEVVR